jgi:hypothetical protein
VVSSIIEISVCKGLFEKNLSKVSVYFVELFVTRLF